MSDESKRAQFLDGIKAEPQEAKPKFHDIAEIEEVTFVIARALGVSEEILRNPEAMTDILISLKALIAEIDINILVSDSVTSQQIENIVNIIKAHVILSKEQIEGLCSAGIPFHYQGITIDPNSGKVELQTVSTDPKYIVCYPNMMHTTTYTPKGNGYFTREHTWSQFNTAERKLNLASTHRETINPDGIVMDGVSKSYDGSGVLVYHSIRQRDEQYPFVERMEVKKNDTAERDPIGTTLRTIEKGPYRLGYETKETVCFETLEQVEQYYRENKGRVRAFFDQIPDIFLYSSEEEADAGMEK